MPRPANRASPDKPSRRPTPGSAGVGGGSSRVRVPGRDRRGSIRDLRGPVFGLPGGCHPGGFDCPAPLGLRADGHVGAPQLRRRGRLKIIFLWPDSGRKKMQETNNKSIYVKLNTINHTLGIFTVINIKVGTTLDQQKI